MNRRQQIHHYVYVACLMAIMVSIPLSKFLLSMSGLLLFVNWIAEWNWKEKWSRLMKNKPAIVIGSFFFVCLLFLINTEDGNAAFHNVMNKLPLLYAPFILATSGNLSGKEQRLIFNSFILATFIATLISIGYLLTHDVLNIREISLFISHIRFSLCIILSICFSIFLSLNVKVYPKWIKIGYLIISLWFITYLFIAQTLTGIAILLALAAFLFFYILFIKKDFPFRKTLIISSILLITSVSGYIIYIIYDYYHADEIVVEELPLTTQAGNPYFHDPNSLIENGSHIYLYVSFEELQDEWNRRSVLPYDSLIASTLIRYLNSKGLNKDREGMRQLAQKDIDYVEKGIANVNYTQGFGVKRALYPILFSFSIDRKMHSTILQRVEYWKAGIAIVKENPCFGVGIGDGKKALDNQLIIMNSPVTYKKGMGCHNQLITYAIIGGVPFLLYFIFVLFYPFLISKKTRSLLYLLFFLTIFISLFTEDTLDSQAGVTLYAFFNAFFLFVFDREKVKFDSKVSKQIAL